MIKFSSTLNNIFKIILLQKQFKKNSLNLTIAYSIDAIWLW